jgi:hypothetical protein
MTRQISKGRCTFCHREVSKASMTMHLQSCEQRAAMQGERESHQQVKKSKALHLVVEGYAYPCTGCTCKSLLILLWRHWITF